MTMMNDSAGPTQYHTGRQDSGFTAREQAAISLQVPDSGEPWLDKMIRRSLRDKLAGEVLTGLLTAKFKDINQFVLASDAYIMADAMFVESDKPGKE